jgi:hypothetical protein
MYPSNSDYDGYLAIRIELAALVDPRTAAERNRGKLLVGCSERGPARFAQSRGVRYACPGTLTHEARCDAGSTIAGQAAAVGFSFGLHAVTRFRPERFET